MSEDLTEESEEKEEPRPGSVLAKGTISLPSLPVEIEIPIEAQAKIAKIVEGQVAKEVAKRLPEAVAEQIAGLAGRDLKGRYSKGYYMSAGLSAFAGVVGYAYFGGILGLLLIAASAGPFLISLLGLYRSQQR